MSNVKLYFNGSEVTINKGSYTMNFINFQSLKETEGGTKRRYIKRLGVPEISVSMPANDSEYATFYTAYVGGTSMTVKYFNPGTGALATFTGFIQDLTAELIEDESTSPEWNISFKITSM